MQKDGTLPAHIIEDLMNAGFIRGAKKENVSPASLDLEVSDEIYAIEGLVLPSRGECIRDLLSLMGAKRVPVSSPLWKDSLYIARLNESLVLPKQIYGYCNPKSSSGRLDVHVRVLADRVPRFDSLTPRGYQGELWVAIFPKSMSVHIYEGVPLTQLRLFTRDTRLSALELSIALQEGLVWHEAEDRILKEDELILHDEDGSLVLTALFSECAGYHCVANKEDIIDIRKIGYYDPDDFFERIHPEDNALRLKRDHFYILSGAERVRIPPGLASEMVPMDERCGDFRSHYAGFLDPGWGWGVSGEGKGRPFTLEVRPFEDLVVRKGQAIAKIRFERMAELPRTHYDTKQSHYLTQEGPKLGKQFKN